MHVNASALSNGKMFRMINQISHLVVTVEPQYKICQGSSKIISLYRVIVISKLPILL